MGFKSFFSRIFKASNSGITDLLNPVWWATDLWGGRKTFSGTRIDPANALTISAYYSILRNISEDVAKMPVKVFEKKDKKKVYLTDHPVYKLFNIQPNEDMDPLCFRETLTHHAIGWGNGYAEIERSFSGVPLALHPIHPSRVTPWRENGKTVYKVRAGGTGLNGDLEQKFIEFQPEDIFHVKGLGAVGYIGYSPVQLMSETLGLALAAQTYGSAFFGNGATPGIIIKHPGKLSDPARKNLRDSWQEQAGADNAHKPKVLEEGMAVDRLSIPPNEAQALETRIYQIRDIARWLRFPLHKLNDLERATFSNIEQLNIEYATDTLSSWTTRFDQQIKTKLLKESEKDVHVTHDFSILLRGDQAAQSKYIETRDKTASITINEKREFYGDDPVEDGDVIFVPVNMQTLEKAIMAPQIDPTNGQPVASADDEEAGDPNETQEVEPIETTPSENSTSATANLSDVLILVAEDAACRVLRKEQKALERASTKYTTSESFVKWADEFYTEQARFIFEVFDPIAKTVNPGSTPKLAQESNNLASICKAVAVEMFDQKVLANHVLNITEKAPELAKCILEGIK